VYCLGALALRIFSSSTFTELGTVSLLAEIEGMESVFTLSRDTESFTIWAEATVLAVKEIAIKKSIL
jgi:hypothetical protein